MLDISVIIATCDRIDFLRRSVKSVLDQINVNIEIIIVNDGKKINVNELGLTDNQLSKISLINNKNPYSGACYSRNQGVLYAKSDLVAFLDDDDYWDSSYLHKMKKIILEKKTDMAAAAFWNVEGENIIPGKIPPIELKVNDFLGRNLGITGSNIVVKKTFYNKMKGFDEALPTSNDIDFVIRFIKCGGSFYRITDRLVYFAQHGGDRLTQVSRRKIKGSLRFYNKYKSEMPKDVKRKAKVRLLLRFGQYKAKISNRKFFSTSNFIKALTIDPYYSIRFIIRILKEDYNHSKMKKA